VPVFIAGTEDNDEADRIARQWHENQHRAALTNVDQVSAVDQLACSACRPRPSPSACAPPRKHVESALAVRDSELARAATARYDFLTLEQSAVIADFEDDTEVVKALVAAAKQGEVQFQRAAQTAVEDRERAAGRAALVTGLTENHAQCPGHAAYLSEEWVEADSEPIAPDSSDDTESEDDDADGGWQLTWVAVHACTNPAQFGHQSRHGSTRATTSGGPGATQPDEAAQEAAKEAARQERRATLAHNKAWREAEPLRRDWLRTLAARKTAPKGAAALITTALSTDSFTARKAMEKATPRAAELLGVDSRDGIDQAAASATDARALLI